MNYAQFIVGIVILIIVGILLNILLASPRMQECPDEWIQDRMPTVGGYDDKEGEYFIKDGKRMEISEFDLQWVNENCNIKPKIVY